MNSDLKKLNSFLEETITSEFLEEKTNATLKKYIVETTEKIINGVNNELTKGELEKIWFSSFCRYEGFIWDLARSSQILSYWVRLGDLIKVENAEIKLNYYENYLNKEFIVKELEAYKKVKKVFNEMPSAPLFYKKMKEIMNEEIGEIITKLHQNNQVDFILDIFSKGLDRFDKLGETTDFSFGDTEDCETVSEFYEKIMSILGIRSSRGLLYLRL